MWTVNRILGGIVGGLLYPFQALPPIIGLAVVSLLVSVPLMLGFRALSDQDALAAAKRRIHAGVFEIRLFNDDLGAITRAQIEIVRHTLSYFRLSFIPMAWMMIPLILLLIQLQFHYGYEGLETGRSAILKVQFAAGESAQAGLGRPADDAVSAVSLEAPPGLTVETPMLWIPTLREADWRVTANQPGSYPVSVRVGEDRFSKSVVFSDAGLRRSPRRPSRGFFDQLLYPAEPPMPAGAPIESITVNYPDGRVSLFGWHTHWLVGFFILTMLFSLLLQKPLRVRL